MDKKPDFQSVKIDYPKKLYTYAFWVVSSDSDMPTPIFSPRAIKSFGSVKRSAKAAIKRSRGLDMHYLDYILVVPLTYQKDFKLKKEMWRQNNTNIGFARRNVSLLEAFDKNKLYNVMVTPAIVEILGKGKSLEMYIAFPMFKSASNAEIEALTRGSDMYVSPEAKNAAIYTIDDMYGYNVIKNEKVKKAIETSEITKNRLN
jgi:hypothetical protein